MNRNTNRRRVWLSRTGLALIGLAVGYSTAQLSNRVGYPIPSQPAERTVSTTFCERVWKDVPLNEVETLDPPCYLLLTARSR